MTVFFSTARTRLLTFALTLMLSAWSLMIPARMDDIRTAYALAVPTGPSSLTLNASASRAYLSRYASNVVTVVDTASQQKVTEIKDVGVVAYAGGSPVSTMSRPSVDPSNNRIYVVNAARVSGSASSTQSIDEWRVYVIDGAGNNVIDSFPVPGGNDLVFDPGTRMLFISTAEDTVAVYDPQTRNKVSTIPVGGRLALNSAAKRLYLGDGNRLYVVSTETNSVVASVVLPAPAAPSGYEQDLNQVPAVRDIAINLQNGRVYVASEFVFRDGRGQSLTLGNVSVVDPGNGQVIGTISDARAPRPKSLAVDGERGKLYIVPDGQVGGQWNVLTTARTSDNTVVGTQTFPGDAATPEGGNRLRALSMDTVNHRLYAAAQPTDQHPADVLLVDTTSDTPQSGPPPAAETPKVDARIEVVWPHDAAGKQASVTGASLINITTYLFQQGTMTAVPCAFDATVRLWRALNNQPAESVATGKRRMAVEGGRSFPVWDFNDVLVSASQDPLNKYYFFVTVDGTVASSNVWSHGADARTYFPRQDTPSGSGAVSSADARIEIVWPHDAAGNESTVAKAGLANVVVDIYNHGTMSTAPLDWSPAVRLYRALNNGLVEYVGQGEKTTASRNGITYPRWVFNDISVSASQDPVNKYYFGVQIDGITTVPNIWSHGSDARTYFPNPDLPAASCQ